MINMGGPSSDIFGDGTSNGGSNYDLVEEVYENMNSFDKRMKLQKMMHNNNNHYDQEYQFF